MNCKQQAIAESEFSYFQHLKGFSHSQHQARCGEQKYQTGAHGHFELVDDFLLLRY